MYFNLIFTAFIGVGGLKTIPHCLKIIKQGKAKIKIFYILTVIQILLQISFSFIRAWIVFLSPIIFNEDMNPECALVGFQIYSFRIKPFGLNQFKNVEMLF